MIILSSIVVSDSLRSLHRNDVTTRASSWLVNAASSARIAPQDVYSRLCIDLTCKSHALNASFTSGVNAPLEFCVRIVLLKWNGQILMKYFSEQFWICSVFTSSFSEAADVNITASLARASVWVANKTASEIFFYTKYESKQTYDYDDIFSVRVLCSSWYFYNNKGCLWQILSGVALLNIQRFLIESKSNIDHD